MLMQREGPSADHPVPTKPLPETQSWTSRPLSASPQGLSLGSTNTAPTLGH